MMQYKDYVAKVEFDPDAMILHGEVIGIRDVVTFQGKSVKEIEKAFRESVDDYLAFCKQRGESPDKPCSGQFIVRIDSDLHRKASILADSSGKSLNSVVADALAGEVNRKWAKSDARASSRASTPRKRKK